MLGKVHLFKYSSNKICEFFYYMESKRQFAVMGRQLLPPYKKLCSNCVFLGQVILNMIQSKEKKT
jgi:hypothetical protein